MCGESPFVRTAAFYWLKWCGASIQLQDTVQLMAVTAETYSIRSELRDVLSETPVNDRDKPGLVNRAGRPVDDDDHEHNMELNRVQAQRDNFNMKFIGWSY